MKIKAINFPDPLVHAARDGTLVVFAGAGVSMGEPANLPDFATLADRIAHGTGQGRNGQPIDHFLGTLKHAGVDVHQTRMAVAATPDDERESRGGGDGEGAQFTGGPNPVVKRALALRLVPRIASFESARQEDRQRETAFRFEARHPVATFPSPC